MKLDKATRVEVVAVIRQATIEAQEMYDEQWLSGDQLGKVMPFFTKDWLKRYGKLLPRERVSVTDERGGVHRSGWCYPRHKIMRMIMEGRMRSLRLDSVLEV